MAIPDSAVTRLEGDVSVVVQPDTENTKSITWNAGADWPENITETAVARVTAWSLTNPPQYVAIDLNGGAETTDYPLYYYPSEDGVPNGATSTIYKTNRMLLRRIEPTGGGGFYMGSPTEEVGRNSLREGQANIILTKPYYVGIYEVTQKQWNLVMGTWPANFTNLNYRSMRPVEQVSYQDIREEDGGMSPTWPESREAYSNSFMGRLLNRTSEALVFDLPTEAQWEWACRAGTVGALNNGIMNLETEIGIDYNLNKLARYDANGGLPGEPGAFGTAYRNSTTENGTATVGSYLPNAWGLYDMLGNVYEWCLDYSFYDYYDAIDPDGPFTGSNRALRGGSWNHAAKNSRSAFRNSNTPTARNAHSGFRVVANIVTVTPSEE